MILIWLFAPLLSYFLLLVYVAVFAQPPLAADNVLAEYIIITAVVYVGLVLRKLI